MKNVQVVQAKSIIVGDTILIGDDDFKVTCVRDAVKLLKSSPRQIVIEAERSIVAQNGCTRMYTHVRGFKPTFPISRVDN